MGYGESQRLTGGGQLVNGKTSNNFEGVDPLAVERKVRDSEALSRDLIIQMEEKRRKKELEK